MEPITIIGLLASASSLLKLTTTLINNLHGLSTRYTDAPSALRALSHEITTLKSSISPLQHYISTTLNEAPIRTQLELATPLQVALRGFEDALQALLEEVGQVEAKMPLRVLLGLRGKVKWVWKEDARRARLEDLRAMTSALHLLVSATALAMPAARAQFRSVALSASVQFSVPPQSIMPSAVYTDDDDEGVATEFPFDDEVVNSMAYRRVVYTARGANKRASPPVPESFSHLRTVAEVLDEEEYDDDLE
ncbi:hypothetical protein EDC01DRAFT_789612 [Geopyxis carbonaria]|nr:hypothetical protein EDC01DRAFT_789612 [Geopyxis carbonaria]